MRMREHVAGMVMALVAAGCGSGASGTESFGVSQQGLTLSATATRVLGFENAADWSVINQTTATHSEGAASSIVAVTGWTEVVSVPLSTLGAVDGMFSVDLQLPAAVSWGEARLVVKIPSQAEWYRDLGSQALSALAPGSFHTLYFAVPADLQPKFGASYTDLTFTLVINAPNGNYLLDRLGVGQHGPVQPPSVDVSLSLPSGIAVTDVVLGASGTLRVADRTDSVTPIGHAQVSNAGTGETNIGTDTHTGNITSLGPVVLRDRAQIHGSVKSSAGVTQQSQVVVSGTVDGAAVLTPVTTLSRALTFPTPGAAITIPPDSAPRTLTPGSHGTISVGSRSTMQLGAGEYHLQSLSVEPEAVLAINASAGPVLVFVRSILNFKGIYQLTGDPKDVFFGVFGGGTISLERQIAGTIVAPNATLRFAPVQPGEFKGSFFAPHINAAEPDLTLTHVPFARWDLIFPATPIVECVNVFKTEKMAIFGYETELDTPVAIPPGANNRLDGASGPVALPEIFEPGVHERVLVVPFAGDSVTWILGGRTATANLQTRRCTLADFPPTGEPDPIAGEDPSPVPRINQPGYVPDSSVGLRHLSAPLAWQNSTTVLGSVLQALQVVPPLPQFTFRVAPTFMGDDNGSEAEPNLIVQVDQILFHNRDLPDCNVNSTCDSADEYDFGVPADAPSFHIRATLWEDDDQPFSEDDTEFVLDIDVDTDTGAWQGHSFGPDPAFDHPIGPEDTCDQAPDGFGFCWNVTRTSPPRVCSEWKAGFMDALGDDFASDGGAQPVAASFSHADLTIINAALPGATFHFAGFLDYDGCIPMGRTASLDQWRLVAGAEMAARLLLTTQHCLDRTGGDCVCPAGECPDVRGARFVTIDADPDKDGLFPEVPNRAGTPDLANLGPTTACVILATSQAAAAQFPDAASCELFLIPPNNEWITTGVPPHQIKLVPSAQSDTTRVAAAVSTLLQRALQENQDILPDEFERPGSAETTFLVNHMCLAGEERTSCTSQFDHRISLRPDVLCTNLPVNNCIDLEKGAYPVCTNPMDPACVAGASRWKYIIMHEFGHEVDGRLFGDLGLTSYNFGVDAAGNLRPDPPGAPDLCQCAHVLKSNRSHCLQSLEMPDRAQGEGWGHFFAAKVWNDAAQTDCTFNYYKEFLFPGNVAGTSPPQSHNCLTPQRWRNSNCLGTPEPGIALTDMGTEIDWLSFFWGVNTQSANSSKLSDIQRIYRRACESTPPPGDFADRVPPVCEGQFVGWESTVLPPTAPNQPGPVSNSLRAAAEEYYGLIGTTAAIAKLNHLRTGGDEHGVSRSTTPMGP